MKLKYEGVGGKRLRELDEQIQRHLRTLAALKQRTAELQKQIRAMR